MGLSKHLVDWLNLPVHLLPLIADRLDLQKDLICFGAVCHAWQSVYTDVQHRRVPRLPFLMLATNLNHDGKARSFYSLTDGTVCNSHVPVPRNRSCRGSSHGWLVTVCQDWQVHLLNPFSSVEILLPDLTTFSCEHVKPPCSVAFLQKAALSANPSLNPNYVVMAIYSSYCSLAYFRPGDSAWTSLDFEYSRVVDVVYCRDKFYFVNRGGEVYSCDLNHGLPKVSRIASSPPGRTRQRTYLAESSGDLLQIVRCLQFSNDGRGCLAFKVFKLDSVELRWIQLENVDGHVLFLGDNSCSVCVKASDVPECKPDAIYSADCYGVYVWGIEYGIGSYDTGVFSLEAGTVVPLYAVETKMKMIVPPPIWIEPPLLSPPKKLC